MNRLMTAVLCVSACAAAARAQISLGTLDDFQDLSTMGWAGASPVNIGTGGPAGAGDAYMGLTSIGGIGPGSVLAADNRDLRWSGDYIAAGVTALSADMVNRGTVPLEMRVVLLHGATERYTSTLALVLPADNAWHTLVFPIGAASLTRVLGSESYEQVARNVSILLFRHDAGTPSSGGTAIATGAGFDNIRAIPGPGALAVLILGCLGAVRRRR